MLNPMRFAFCTLATVTAVGAASAQGWPTRPVTMVVPFAAGSATDTAGRILAVGLSEALGPGCVKTRFSKGRRETFSWVGTS
jgi:tripartite-type tricarboxylate transporter receptor subunit TctC